MKAKRILKLKRARTERAKPRSVQRVVRRRGDDAANAACPNGPHPERLTIARCLKGALWPTIWLHAKCLACGADWTERYEFDFAIIPAMVTPPNDQAQ